MNQVQKWLAEKEARMPSKNHPPSKIGLAMYKTRKKIAQLAGNIAGKIGSKIAHQYKIATNLQYNMNYSDRLRREKEENERLAELRAEGFEPEENYVTQWDNLDFEVKARMEKKCRGREWAEKRFDYDLENASLNSLVQSAREDEFVWDYIKHKDRLKERYQARKQAWQTQGYDYDSNGKIWQKLQDIRKNAYRKAKSRQLQELTTKIDSEELGSWDLKRALVKEELYCQITGEEPEGLVERISKIYNEKAPSIKVSDFYKEHPGFMIVHGIRGVVSRNNGALGTSREKVKEIEKNWRNFFGNVLDNSPSISCSVVSKDSETYRIYGGIGVLLRDGKIQHASCQDEGTYAFTPKLRLPVSGHGKYLRQNLEAVVRCINPKNNAIWNEVGVAKPEIAGVFFVEYNPKIDHYRGSHCAPVSELAGYAQSRGLPLYKFENGIGFTQVNPQDYIKQELEKMEAA